MPHVCQNVHLTKIVVTPPLWKTFSRNINNAAAVDPASAHGPNNPAAATQFCFIVSFLAVFPVCSNSVLIYPARGWCKANMTFVCGVITCFHFVEASRFKGWCSCHHSNQRNPPPPTPPPWTPYTAHPPLDSCPYTIPPSSPTAEGWWNGRRYLQRQIEIGGLQTEWNRAYPQRHQLLVFPNCHIIKRSNYDFEMACICFLYFPH